VTWLSLIVLIPLGAAALKTAGMGFDRFLEVVTSPRVVASYRITFGCALAAALTNVVFGMVVAWTLVRYRFPGKRLLDALVDLPFALPTAVAGIALTALYSESGWIGQFLYPLGLQTAYSKLGIYIALTFIGLPFVVRTVQPVLEDLSPEIEEASAMLGATRGQTFTRIVFPTLAPSLISGFGLSFARAIGEYGSVVFISGNMPMKTEITPLLIVTQLEQYNYDAATAIAVVLLLISFVMLFLVNRLQRHALKSVARPGAK